MLSNGGIIYAEILPFGSKHKMEEVMGEL